jgi:hypothetical protein
VVPRAVRAQETYFSVRISELKLVEGELPQPSGRRWPPVPCGLGAYAVLDGPGEAYVWSGATPDDRRDGEWDRQPDGAAMLLVVRAPAGASVTGLLAVPNSDWSGLVPLRFSLEPSLAAPDARRDFHLGREAHYERLLVSQIPGAAWFRRQAAESRRVKRSRPATSASHSRSRAFEPGRSWSACRGNDAVLLIVLVSPRVAARVVECGAAQ